MTQPKALEFAADALQLSGWLDRRHYALNAQSCLDYAAELRRQHAEIENMHDLLGKANALCRIRYSRIEELTNANSTLTGEIERLQATIESQNETLKIQADAMRKALARIEQMVKDAAVKKSEEA